MKSSRAGTTHFFTAVDLKPLQSRPFHSINLLSHFALLRGVVSTTRWLGGLVHDLRTDFMFTSDQERTSFKFHTNFI